MRGIFLTKELIVNRRVSTVAFLSSLVTITSFPVALAAQYVPPGSPTPKTDSAKPAGGSPAPTPAAAPALNFSGVLFGNYQYRGEAANRAQNRFEVERAYLTFRLAAGKRAGVRVTADVFQQ